MITAQAIAEPAPGVPGSGILSHDAIMGVLAAGLGGRFTGQKVLVLIPDLAWQVQLVAFALFSIGAIVAARVFLTAHPLQSDQPTLNRRGEQYVGRIFTLQQPVVNGEGKICVDDSTWKINGSDCPAGTRVKVIGVNGVVLQVEAED